MVMAHNGCDRKTKMRGRWCCISDQGYVEKRQIYFIRLFPRIMFCLFCSSTMRYKISLPIAVCPFNKYSFCLCYYLHILWSFLPPLKSPSSSPKPYQLFQLYKQPLRNLHRTLNTCYIKFYDYYILLIWSSSHHHPQHHPQQKFIKFKYRNRVSI